MQINDTLSRTKVLGIALVSFLLTLPALSYGEEKLNTRGLRYCEIVIAKSQNNVGVYNTTGVGDCPEDVWKKMNVDQIKKATNAVFVRLNGPRYLVIDGFTASEPFDPTIKTIEGLKVRELSQLVATASNFFLMNIPYHPRVVKRHTTFIYEAGKPVYELVDNTGHVFLMYSYSTGVASQTEKTLADLGKKLKLPPGWKFKTGILKETAKVETNSDTTQAMRDDLMNEYQESEKDLLP